MSFPPINTSLAVRWCLSLQSFSLQFPGKGLLSDHNSTAAPTPTFNKIDHRFKSCDTCFHQPNVYKLIRSTVFRKNSSQIAETLCCNSSSCYNQLTHFRDTLLIHGHYCKTDEYMIATNTKQFVTTIFLHTLCVSFNPS